MRYKIVKIIGRGVRAMQDDLQRAIHAFIERAQEIFGNHVRQIILYGSYARGDYHEESDIDIMLLVDLQQEECWEYRKRLMGEVFDINLEYDTMIVPTTVNAAHFKEWLPVYPFYQNVVKEGVELFAA